MRLSYPFLVVLLFLLVVSTAGCGKIPQATPSPTPVIPTATLNPTSTFTPTMVPPTATPTITPTPTWVLQPAGQVTCPILLYHHVLDINPPELYYISPADFEAEMNLLHDWGYTPIPISLLVQAITQGANLPPRPVVISFDDGNEDIYTHAFPIMERLGFTGVLYIVSNRLGAKDYLSTPEITQMVASGWEVGNHSLSHTNLVDNPGLLYDEAVQSRRDLQAALGLPIDTFAYPFGAANESIMNKVSKYGYKAAVGLGTSPIQGPFNLFYLNRIVLDYTIDINKFTSLMPWSGPIK